MMAKIDYKIIGDPNFLRDAEYSSYLFNTLKEYEDKFLLAEEIIIHFEESINPDPNKPFLKVLTVSDDGKNIKLAYRTRRDFLPKGGLSKPTPAEFLQGLAYYLEHTVIADDNKRFEQLNPGEE